MTAAAAAARSLFRFTDAQWEWVGRFVAHGRGTGRPLSDAPRRRVEAVFHVALSRRPWREMPGAFGKWDTVHRFFRRLAHEGVWERLLIALGRFGRATPLSEIRFALCLVARRSWRMRAGMVRAVARAHGLWRALPKPPEHFPDRAADRIVRAMPLFGFLGNTPLGEALRDPALNRAVGEEIRLRRELHTLAGGLRRVPAWLRAVW